MSIWVLAISDLHLGSAFSLWPPDTKGSWGEKPSLNQGQRYLWRNWQTITETVLEMTNGRIDVLLDVGDSIHGFNKKGSGEYLIEPDLAFQGKAFLDAVRPLTEKANEIYKFRGSRYHVGDQGETEEWIAHELGAIQDDEGHSCWLWLPTLEVGGVTLDVAHHQSAVMINRAMPLERERRFARQVTELKPNPDLIIRGHGHTFVYLIVDGEAQLGLPPMQLQTPFAKASRAPNRLLSKYLGVCLIEVVPGAADSTLPLTVHPLLFRHPPLPVRTYKEKSPCTSPSSRWETFLRRFQNSSG